MQILQNQTDPEVLRKWGAHAEGVGIFAVADITSEEIDATAVYYIEQITYAQCLRRGALALAFKWIPEIWKSKELDCEGTPCVQTCSPLSGCICIKGICKKPTSKLPS